MASSSSFPTDLRRSGCRSESHQPRSLPCSVQAGLYSSGVHAVKRTRLGGRDSSGTCASARRQGGPGSAARGARRLQLRVRDRPCRARRWAALHRLRSSRKLLLDLMELDVTLVTSPDGRANRILFGIGQDLRARARFRRRRNRRSRSSTRTPCKPAGRRRLVDRFLQPRSDGMQPGRERRLVGRHRRSSRVSHDRPTRQFDRPPRSALGASRRRSARRT